MEQTPNMADIMRIAQSDSGRRLIALLQQQGGSSLQDALSHASSGNYNAARQNLSSLLASEEVKQLLRDLEGKL